MFPTGRPARHVAVVNAGGWGTALATLLGNAGHEVRLWCRRPELADEINATRENRSYLPGVGLPPMIEASARMDEVVSGARAVIFVPISTAFRETVRQAAPFVATDAVIAHGSKGLEHPTLLRLSELAEAELGSGAANRVVAISGPTHAEEVARGLPTACVVASRNSDAVLACQSLLHGPTFRVYTSDDIVGVELCGALKNVIALAVGGSDGLGYGDNARAALITRALAEIGRLVVAAGGNVMTVAGLAGIGDVVATCTSRHSRNRWAGEQLGRGRKPEEILGSTRQVVEGVPAARAAVELAHRHKLEMPVCREVYRVLYESAHPRETLSQLMGRDATSEL